MPKKRYTVYNNRTDFPVIAFATAEKAAEACGLTKASFYCAVTGQKTGNNNHWTIMVYEPKPKGNVHVKRAKPVKADLHRIVEPYALYTVYNNYTDEMVCLDVPAEEAAFAMGVQMKSFWGLVTRNKNGVNHKWHIEVKRRKR